MGDALTQWNALSPDEAAQAILPCCGSRAWAVIMTEHRPIGTAEELIALAREMWRGLPQEDVQEAFRSHPRIGERNAPAHATEQSASWSAEEQRSAAATDASEQLAQANARYERRFGRTFLICASGKNASEILAALEQRLSNDPEVELRVAAEEQRRITELRLLRWLQEGAR